MAIYHAQNKTKLFLGAKKVKQAYIGNQKVYSSGSTVTYRVDTNASYTEEADSGASCLSPKTFTPQKAGWSFVGWREDKTASSGVLGSKVMGDSPITLYAVFRQTITVTCYNGSTAASAATGYRYYNNGTVVNPSFTLHQAGLSGWTARGWSTGTAGNSGITYNNGASFTRDSNITLYGMYQQTITLTTVANKVTTNRNGIRYYNSNGNVINPTFTVSSPTLSGASFRGWSSNAGNAAIANGSISNLTLSASTTRYAVFKYADVNYSHTYSDWMNNNYFESPEYTFPSGKYSSAYVQGSYVGYLSYCAPIINGERKEPFANRHDCLDKTAKLGFFYCWESTQVGQSPASGSIVAVGKTTVG